MTKTQWQAISAAKQKALLASIPPEWLIHADILPPDSQLDVSAWPETSGWFTKAELEITSSPAAVILEKTASGSWTAESVARAFCKRAAAAHQLTNCLSETLFPEAIKTAQALDTHLAATGKPLGPLHGLPISIKDNFNIAGKDSTLGFTAWVGQPATHNSILIDLLKAAGAVLYVKTNVPTAMMIAETVNNVFGRTTNPFNRLTSSGGSSGGESALIAFRGSPLGVGTDIGIFTLKPSFGRFPNFKTKSGLAGQESVTSVNGPMARDLRSISLWAEAVVGSQPWITDPKCLPIPWREVELKRSLKIGILWNDGMVRPTPPVRRALKETAEKLRLAGHEVVDWQPIGHAQAADILDRFFLSDGGKSVEKLLAMSDEPIRPEMERYGRAVDHGVYNLWQLHQERNTLQKDYLDRWNTLGLDAILAPTAPFAAVEHSKFRHVAYTGVFNILDYSCISFPCRVAVDQAVDVPAVGETPLSKEDALVQSEYNPGVIHGMSVSLQLVGRRLEEEKVVKMCDAILQAL
ncbi:general amidase GmdB [Trichophyton verrucosum HKI 0517]|uniref:General amidase GmdB n=1 Tax=Trichophyton verrucosum (strain HKI 0517) TaxID=663202 RepID=D4D9W9_TRIVH|nr:general amidase GmdB [Trichophyton verrucosum HKI 0517]EFE41346.1 general amidase GmdB [Trichophyton verrucosum HKI 0517]